MRETVECEADVEEGREVGGEGPRSRVEAVRRTKDRRIKVLLGAKLSTKPITVVQRT